MQMVLYKPDYNFNDCKLPNKKTTPSILAVYSYGDVACEGAYGVGY